MSEFLQVGVIGTGFGKVHVQAFNSHPRARVSALCSTNLDRAATVARELEVEHAYGSYREMLAEAPIDAVSVVTPPAHHVEITRAALEAGKHVLCAKPLAVALSDARMVLEEANASGLVHAIDNQLRFAPATIHAHALLSSRAIGRPLSVVSSMYLGASPYYSNPSASPNKNSWFSSRSDGGGFLLADAPHQFDRLLYWFGPVRTVFGRARTAMPRIVASDGTVIDCDADDSYHALMEFESGLMAVVLFTTVGRPAMGRRLEVHGDAGSMLIEGPGWDQTIKLAKASDREYTDVQIPETLTDSIGGSPMYGLVDQFVRAVLDGELMSPSFGDGYRTQELIEAVNRANDSGQQQVLPLTT